MINKDDIFSSVDVKEILDEAVQVASALDSNLGDNQPTKKSKRKAEKILQFIKSEVVALPPILGNVMKLRKERLPENLYDELARINNYYFVPIPLTLFPRAGWSYYRLEFEIAFSASKGSSGLVFPVIHDMFPSSSWTQIIEFRDKFQLGIDNRLNFEILTSKIGLDTNDTKLNTDLNYHLLLGPFEYKIQRPKIMSAGIGNEMGFWRLDGTDTILKEHLELMLILQIPKDSSSIQVNADAKLVVHRKFDMLAAELNDILGFLSEKARNYFKSDAPLYAAAKWENITHSHST